jgi:zinc protease
VRSILVDARGPRPYFVLAPVQTDKTRESLAEIHKELRGMAGAQPVTKQELAKTQKDQTLTLSGAWETAGALAGTIRQLIRFQLPEDYYETYPAKVLALKFPRSKASRRKSFIRIDAFGSLSGIARKSNQRFVSLGWARCA